MRLQAVAVSPAAASDTMFVLGEWGPIAASLSVAANGMSPEKSLATNFSGH